ncbi:MAG: Capsular polysaccharide biosynthesis protein [Parcubacteria group bacterium GW2011_GWD2_38_11]|uniref:Capsular polysaccharide biosynthesis protein n=1 Tax=Candidatus Magasanikbacteria bacterium GW2011_GWE2_42_7 TaxID=1619052 RepID=A0A0G1BAD0_9BACT|nr:MAG: Capsular polysaccharide biosynthesis protein [Parcubacteria group bacterium GW2011_GWD2_38_11]KKS70330.1 MAG: Capsular polysaccharide biosynthesis protein [Candidatus Magasanikbacteria bacterium GW2011_GWE2_42_7]
MIQRIKNNAFARNSAILFAGSMVGNVLNYAFHLIAGRMISVQVYGEVESLVSLMNIISVPAMTLAMVATKYAAHCKADDDKSGSYEILKYLNKKVFTYGLPIFLLALFTSPMISHFLNIKSSVPLVIIWISMFFSFLVAVNSGMLNGWQKFKDVSMLGIWGTVAKLISMIVLVKLSFGLNGIVGSFMLGAVASYIASLGMLKFLTHEKEECGHDKHENLVDYASMKKYIVPVFFGSLAISMMGNIDMVIAKHNLDALTAGQYGALTIVAKIIFFATGVIGSVLFSMSAGDHHKKSNSRKVLKNASMLMAVVCLAAIGVYAIIPGQILALLFGNKYASVASYLVWFAIMVTFYSFVNMLYSYLLSVNKTGISYLLLVISMIALISLLFFGTSIKAIVGIISIAQIAAILAGLFLLFDNPRIIKT